MGKVTRPTISAEWFTVSDAAQVLRMDLDGKVLATVGKAGTGLGEFGEAHIVAVSPGGDIWVADSVNGAVQKFVKK